MLGRFPSDIESAREEGAVEGGEEGDGQGNPGAHAIAYSRGFL